MIRLKVICQMIEVIGLKQFKRIGTITMKMFKNIYMMFFVMPVIMQVHIEASSNNQDKFEKIETSLSTIEDGLNLHNQRLAHIKRMIEALEALGNQAQNNQQQSRQPLPSSRLSISSTVPHQDQAPALQQNFVGEDEFDVPVQLEESVPKRMRSPSEVPSAAPAEITLSADPVDEDGFFKFWDEDYFPSDNQ